MDETSVLTIMQGEDIDELDDFTEESSCVINSGIISFKVHHFSL